MFKFMYVLLPIFIILFLVPFSPGANIYEAVKNSTVQQPISPSKSEHGKWNGILRNFLAFIVRIINFILAPLKKGFDTGTSIIKEIIPEGKGLDTNHTFFTGVLDDFKKKVSLVVPGTLWCGPGNIADNDTEVGKLVESDTCCKNHDLCPQNIAAGEKKYGLENTGLFTRSLCSCDEDFYNCLKKTDSLVSKKLGETYFNTLGPQCFELVNCSLPSVRCWKHQKRGFQYRWSQNPKF